MAPQEEVYLPRPQVHLQVASSCCSAQVVKKVEDSAASEESLAGGVGDDHAILGMSGCIFVDKMAVDTKYIDNLKKGMALNKIKKKAGRYDPNLCSDLPKLLFRPAVFLFRVCSDPPKLLFRPAVPPQIVVQICRIYVQGLFRPAQIVVQGLFQRALATVDQYE